MSLLTAGSLRYSGKELHTDGPATEKARRQLYSSGAAHSAVVDQQIGDDAVMRHRRLVGKSRASTAVLDHVDIMTYMLYIMTLSLSATFVYCGQTVGWIKMKLGVRVGLGPGHIKLDGEPAPPHGKRHSSPHFRNLRLSLRPYNSAHVYCGQTAEWIKMPLGRLRPRWHCIRWGPSSPSSKGEQPRNFRSMSIVAKWSPISATAELLFVLLHHWLITMANFFSVDRGIGAMQKNK